MKQPIALLALLMPLASLHAAPSPVSPNKTMTPKTETPMNDLAQQTETGLDNDWRFHRGAAEGAQVATFNDAAWRRVQLPHDWSIEDLPPTGAQLTLTSDGWRFHAGDDASWKNPAFDDSAWTAFAAPITDGELPPFLPNSYGWYRRKFSVPANLRGKDVELVLGKVDDVDETFVNGVRVGAAGSPVPDYRSAYDELRRYPVPAKLLEGDGNDVVAIRVYNGAGSGGLYAPALTASTRSGPFDSAAPGGASQGFTVGGVGWYRRGFTLPRSQRGRTLRVTFDGVYMNSTVWFNGQQLGVHPYGYTSFSYDLTPLMRVGAANILAVRVDASGLTSRWYSGSGIYRHVHLTSAPLVHFAPNGTYVTTPDVKPSAATVRVRSALRNDDLAAREVTVTTRIVNAAGKTVASGRATQTVAPASDAVIEAQITVPNPSLWSPDKPTLYRLISSASAGVGGTSETTTFGIRTLSFDAVRGFVLNGTRVLLRGGCVHHDNGPLGSAAYDRAGERRVELLKAAGFNAIRTSHNPPSPAFLAACDRQGVLVVDEAFDAWNHGKNNDDYAKYFKTVWRSDIASMVERDRNHPSIIQWSIGNEIPEQGTDEGNVTAKMLSDYVKTLDPTRPTTLACNSDYSPGRDGYFAAVGVAGYNYKPGDYIKDHERHPEWLMQGTESFPRSAFEAWMPVVDNPHVIGDFVWTAMDYLGEAGIGRTIPKGASKGFVGEFPYTVAGCGDLDITGVRKPQSYYRGMMWGVGPRVAAFVGGTPQGEPVADITYWGWYDEHASWTWPGTEGKNREVRVYANTPNVKLLLNGRDLGTKAAGRAAQFTAIYAVPYEPGELVAVGLDEAGKEVGRWSLKTAGVPAQIRLTPDRKTISADGRDLSYVAVEVLDAQGVLCPNAANLVKFSLQGGGQIAGAGNGDPRNIQSFQRPQHAAFEGRALVIVEAGERAGKMRLSASADGLKAATTEIATSALRAP